ncbi:MAG: polysaccharide biosynthesis/export family protein [bacterium]|nr:polysaccharide biosynthesis/export family protein [bacterium]
MTMRKATTFLAIVFVSAGLLSQAEEPPVGTEGPPPPEAEAPLPVDMYLICPQDIISVAVVNEVDLTSDFEVSKDGTIKYPYLEYIPIAGKTVKQVETLLTNLLKDGWLVDPQVIVRVKLYSQKLVYVMGQVNRPGQQSFSGQNEMTLYRAISMAGGFTRIAQMKKVVLMTTDEKNNEKRLVVDVSDIIDGKAPDPPIKANDRIYVDERFF